MARKINLEKISIRELEALLRKRLRADKVKKAELSVARARVKELEAYFSTLPEGTSSTPGRKRSGKIRRGSLRDAVLGHLQKGPAPLREIVAAVKGNYASVAQILVTLKRKKVIEKSSKRGAPYSLVHSEVRRRSGKKA